MPNPFSISAFEDIAGLEEDQVREIIARVGRDDLTVALKAATEPLKDKVLGCMSEEECQALTQYMEFLGPMRLSEVEVMQAQIVSKFGGDSDSDDVFV
jgi:flagellar motor switch protein FliG